MINLKVMLLLLGVCMCDEGDDSSIPEQPNIVAHIVRLDPGECIKTFVDIFNKAAYECKKEFRNDPKEAPFVPTLNDEPPESPFMDIWLGPKQADCTLGKIMGNEYYKESFGVCEKIWSSDKYRASEKLDKTIKCYPRQLERYCKGPKKGKKTKTPTQPAATE